MGVLIPGIVSGEQSVDFVSSTMIAGDGGVNILISGLTGGSVFLEVKMAHGWERMPNLDFTLNGAYHVLTSAGRNIRVATLGLTGNVNVEVTPVGRH